MARLKDLKSPWTGRTILEQMKAAKTGKEMIESWISTMPSRNEYKRTAAPWGLVPEEAPELIEYYAQKQMVYYYENSTLDPKTAKLIQLAICAVQNVPIGVYNHAKGAMARGATKQEILDTCFLAAFECSKHGVMGFLDGLNMFLKEHKKGKKKKNR